MLGSYTGHVGEHELYRQKILLCVCVWSEIKVNCGNHINITVFYQLTTAAKHLHSEHKQINNHQSSEICWQIKNYDSVNYDSNYFKMAITDQDLCLKITTTHVSLAC